MDHKIVLGIIINELMSVDGFDDAFAVMMQNKSTIIECLQNLEIEDDGK